jgi:hypothetical protein
VVRRSAVCERDPDVSAVLQRLEAMPFLQRLQRIVSRARGSGWGPAAANTARAMWWPRDRQDRVLTNSRRLGGQLGT